MASCRPTKWALFAFLLYSPFVTLIITGFLHPNTHEIAGSVSNNKVDDNDVYHSAEVFEINYAEMSRKFKIYMYPDEDEITMLTVEWYDTHDHFLLNLMDSYFLTEDPAKAHLFFIPVDCNKLRVKLSFKTSFEEVTTMFGKYVSGLINKYPYWNKTLGTDHFSFRCNDFDVGVARFVPMLVNNSIRVVSSSTYGANFIPHKDFSSPSRLLEPVRGNDMKNRTTLGYWAGIANTNTTMTLLNLWGGDTELDIQNTRYDDDKMAKLQSAKFCICPIGTDNTNKCTTMAIINNCVPVILENYYNLPFNDVLNWQKFSVILNERDVYRLKDILKAKEGADYRILYNNLIKVRRHFQWNSPPEEYDAFHMIMYELWLRRHTARF